MAVTLFVHANADCRCRMEKKNNRHSLQCVLSVFGPNLVKCRNLCTSRYLVELDLPVEVCDGKGNTPVHACAKYGLRHRRYAKCKSAFSLKIFVRYDIRGKNSPEVHSSVVATSSTIK